VSLLCTVLEVSRSGYYAWRDRLPGPRQQRQEALMRQLQQSYERNDGVYGSPRLHLELKDQGLACCRNTVARLMQQMQLRAVTCRKFRVQTTDSGHGLPVAANLLQQDFQAQAPNQVWVADITYVFTDEGVLYLAGIKDLCTRKIVGWSMDRRMPAELVCDALKMALGREHPAAGLIHHSDRGSQYASRAFQDLLAEHGIRCSMSAAGNCYANAAMESFWGSLKQELVYQRRFRTAEAARAAIFQYIEVFYNRQRRHSALGYISPEQFERQVTTTQAT
jgi:transposase InsO family protein